MPRLVPAGLFALLSLSVFISVSAAAEKSSRPNVVVFLVDDMGWMDCGINGSAYYKTPNIDRFAKRALRFTDAYAQPLCSPTRASMLTGQYSARHGITTASGHQPPQPAEHVYLPTEAKADQPMLLPESKNYLEPSQYTLAEALRDAGYRTAHIGKWHLGLTQEYWPEQQGFDVGFHCHPDPGPPGNYFSPYGVVAEGKPGGKTKVGTITDGPPGEYIVDRQADEAVRFIETKSDKPFFLNLWCYGVHGPWGHKEEYTREFAATSDPRGMQGNPIMASMLRSVDECFGRILDALDRDGLTENTIIVFYSDNGGNVHSNTTTGRKPIKTGDKVEGTQLADWAKWAGDRPPTNNAPLRDGKGTLYEGGTRVPLMWSWANKISAGETSAAVVGPIDLYPTVLDLVGVPVSPNQKIDGVSYAKVLNGSGKLDRDAYFDYHPHAGNGRAGGVWVRNDDWKLLRWFGFDPGMPERYELYNLRDDLSEATNLATAMPEKVAELDRKIDAFLADTGALYPRPNPAYLAAQKTAEGWTAGRDATLEIRDHTAVVTNKDDRTTIQILKVPAAEGSLTLRFRVRSNIVGKGLVLWGTKSAAKFQAERRAEFDLPPAGEWQEKAVAFSPDEPPIMLRVDGMKPGTLEYEWLRLERTDGTVVKEWKF